MCRHTPSQPLLFIIRRTMKPVLNQTSLGPTFVFRTGNVQLQINKYFYRLYQERFLTLD